MIIVTFQINNLIESRLDIYLAKQLHPISRSRIKTYIEKSLVLVNNNKTKPGYILQEGDIVKINIEDNIQTDKKLIAEKIDIKTNKRLINHLKRKGYTWNEISMSIETHFSVDS